MRKPTSLLAVLLTAVLAVLAVLAVREVADRTPGADRQVADHSIALVKVNADLETPAACREDATRIHAVQGSGAASPLVGRVVTVQGVVVGDFQRGDGDLPFGTNLGGYAVQEEDADADDDPLTSEGIYVFDSNTDVAVGDLVRVTGRVTEFYGLTEISSVTSVIVCASGVDLPTAARILLPVASVKDLEAYEGMLVRFSQALVISEYYDFDRYGEIVLSAPPSGAERQFQPTSRLDPDDPAVAEAIDLAQRSRIVLDDGRSHQNPDPARHPNGLPFSMTNRFRGGDKLVNVTGVLDYSFGHYRVQPTVGATYVPVNPRPGVPRVGGDLRVGAFNVLNYFTRFGRACGPKGTTECRGADDAAELGRQRAKIVAAIGRLDAHVVALLEVENDADEAALADLVAGLNDALGAGTYAYVSTGGPIGHDAIRVGLIYQAEHVSPVGAPAVLDAPAFVNPRNAGVGRNRPALAQTFMQLGSGATFTVVANHLKSKGSECGAGDDDPVQGNCNLTRTLAAKALMAWLATDPTASGDPDFLLLGDYNSYAREDPIRALAAGVDGVPGTADDVTDLLAAFVGEDAYTFVFDGQFGYLDYAFATPSLLAQVTGAAAWHINADEPDLIDYDLDFKTPGLQALYAPDPYRSSDHDPVLVGLSLDAASQGPKQP